jgi:hypothetical protein
LPHCWFAAEIEIVFVIVVVLVGDWAVVVDVVVDVVVEVVDDVDEEVDDVVLERASTLVEVLEDVVLVDDVEVVDERGSMLVEGLDVVVLVNGATDVLDVEVEVE